MTDGTRPISERFAGRARAFARASGRLSTRRASPRSGCVAQSGFGLGFRNLFQVRGPNGQRFSHLLLILEAIVDACHTSEGAGRVIEEFFHDVRRNAEFRKWEVLGLMLLEPLEKKAE